MITTDLDRLEYTQANSENSTVFRSSGTDIPVKDASHIKVYVTTTGTFSGSDFANNKLTLNSHPHLNTEVIRVSSSTDDLPLGLLANTDYFIINKGTNDWQVATSEGSSSVHAFTDAGTGTLTWTKPILKTITTDYTIVLSGTTATLTWATDKRPANGDKVLLLRQVPFEQNTDLQNNSLFEAESVETQLDLIVNMSQQLKNTTARDLKFSDLLTAENATDTQATLNVTSDDRKNKALKFDNSGNLTVSKLNLDEANDYVLEAKSWSIETGGYTKTYDAEVASNNNDYSAKEYAVGSTVTSAKDYAIKTSAAVTGSEFSAKEYAQGTQASTGGSSKDYAQKTDGGVSGATSDHSAKAWALGGTGVTDTASKGSAKQWALGGGSSFTIGNKVDGGSGSYASKAYAQSTEAGTSTYGGSAKGWASTAYDAAVPGAGSSDRSALHYSTDASNSALAAKNSAAAVANSFDSFDDTYLGAMKDPFIFTASSDSGLLLTHNGHGLLDGNIVQVASAGTLPTGLSASTNYYVVNKTTNNFKLATSSGGSAIAWTNAGSGQHTWVYGSPTTNGTWTKDSATITVVSNVGIRVGQKVSGSGIPTSPIPNVLSVVSTTVVPSIDNTLGIGFSGESDGDGIPVPDTFCPTLIPTLLTTVIEAESLPHVPLVVGLP